MRNRVRRSLESTLFLCAVALSACTSGSPSTGEENVDRQSTKLELDGGSTGASPPSTSTSPSLTLAWDLKDEVTTLIPPSSLALRVENHESEPLDGQVVLDLLGLGTKRSVDLGTHHIPAQSTVTISWDPASSPIAPVGTIAHAIARVTFTRNGVTPSIPARPVYFAFSSDGKTAFVSSKDGNAVRLASLGRAKVELPGKSIALDAADWAALRPALGAKEGKLDGKAIHQSADEVVRGALVKDASKPGSDELQISDTISFEDESSSIAASRVMAPSPVPFGTCPSGTLPQVTTSICTKWTPNGFYDIGVSSSSVVPEDYDPGDMPASYATAVVTNNSNTVWSGRLDSNGCTPVVSFCPSQALMLVDSFSIQAPGYTLGPLTIPPSRDFHITPGMLHTATLYYASYTQTGQVFARAEVHPSTSTAAKVVRAASVVSRILAMPDNGVQVQWQPLNPFKIHTENGCMTNATTCGWGFDYNIGVAGGPYCGEACAVGDDAWFGPSLSQTSNGNVLTGRHTTESAYSVAHEIGHLVQFAGHGAPGSDGYVDRLNSGDCSCDHVNDGNRIHCLQSRHPNRTSNIEGFAQHYATRVMNDRGTDARFTYYKDFRNINWIDFSVFGMGWVAIHNPSTAPPIPVRAGAPYATPAYPNTHGWVHTYCGDVSHSSEYDWLTFLWSVNGTTVASQQGSMADLFAIFGDPSIALSFSAGDIMSKASLRFGANSPKYFKFRSEMTNNGVDL